MARGFVPFDVGALRTGIVAWDKGIRDAAEHAVRVTVAEGEEDMRRTIVEMDTPTGRARAAAGGGIAGRVESGEMYLDIESEVNVEGNTIIGEWGWLKNFQRYYGAQEEGTEGDADRKGIEGMNALGKSSALVRDRIRARMRRLGKENGIG